MRRNICNTLIVMLVVVASLSALGQADSSALKDRLGRELAVELTDVTIAEALSQIGEQAGVPFELSDEAVWKLPEGRETRLSMTLEGQLAQGLEQVLDEFFLRYAVGSESVVIYPRPELQHILGRPTPRLLRLLKNIYTNQMWLSGGIRSRSFTQAVINQLADEPVAVVPLNEFENAVSVLAIFAERTEASGTSGSSTVSKTPVTLAAILEETVGGRDSVVWSIAAPEFPDQPAQIRIVSRLDYSKALLGQIVDVSLHEEEGLTVLRKLTTLANFDLEIVGENRPWADDSWLHRTITLEALNVTVREALNQVTRALGGQVGTVNYERGSYEVVGPHTPAEGDSSATPARASGIPYYYIIDDAARRSRTPASGGAASPASTGSSADDYVGKISIPMGEGDNRYYIEFMLRERDLPEELRRLRAEKIKEIFASFSEGTESN